MAKINDIKDKIKLLNKHCPLQVLWIESEPGVGKTSAARQAASELGISCRVIHAPTMQPEDCGMPVVSGGVVNFALPESSFPLTGAKDWPERGILVIDDAAQCTVSQQQFWAHVLRERDIHGRALLKGWQIVATANRASDGAGSARIMTHLADRVTIVTMDTDVSSWTSWAASMAYLPEMIGFINFKPELLSKFDKAARVSPTPRSWGDIAERHKAGLVDFDLDAGNVGEGPATELHAFLQVFKSLPDLDAILEGKNGTGTDAEKTSVKFAVCGALASRAAPKNIDSAAKYISGYGNEFLALYFRDVINFCGKDADKKRAISESKAFTQYALIIANMLK